MDKTRFRLVFEKLSKESASEATHQESLVRVVEAMRPEMEEIAELRRLVLEITEPPPVSYTTT